MKVLLFCDTHDELLKEFNVEPGEFAQVESAIVQAHAAHTQCGMSIECDFGDPDRFDELHVRCLDCKPDSMEVTWRCPPYMVGALTLAFHTSHEGHRLRISYRGNSWESPGKRTAKSRPTAAQRRRMRR